MRVYGWRVCKDWDRTGKIFVITDNYLTAERKAEAALKPGELLGLELSINQITETEWTCISKLLCLSTECVIRHEGK